MTDLDEAFFQRCLHIGNGERVDGRHVQPVPIFLGVGRAQKEVPDTWLAFPEYKGLAAAIGVFPNDTRWVPRWFTSPAYGDQKRLPSLSGALANAYSQAAHADPPAPIPWMRSLIELMPADKADPKSPLVGGREETESEYPLWACRRSTTANWIRFQQEKLSVSTAQHILPPDKSTGEPNEKFAGRMVILGKTEVLDTFSVPGPVPPLRGVLIHACAAYTFAQDPLYEFKPGVRLGLDLGLSLLLIGAFACLYVPKEDERHRRHQRAHGYLLLGVLIAAALLVRWAGVLWLDFVVIVFALAIHPTLERRADAWWEQRMEAYRDRSRSPEQVPSELPIAAEPPATEAENFEEGGDLMPYLYRSVSILLLTGSVCSPPCSAQSPARQAEAHREVVAHVTYAHGSVYVDGRPYSYALKASGDPHPPLCAGWTLSCKNQGVLEFCFDGGRIVRLTAASLPFHVPHVPQEKSAREAGKAVLTAAGLHQAIAVGIFSPPPHDGVVWPDKLVFRWTPTPQQVRLVLRLSSSVRDDTPPLWESPEIEAGKKEFVFPEAREALRKLRARKPDAQVELSLVTPDDKSTEILFRLLSQAEETKLKAELRALESEKEPERSIGRSYAYMRRICTPKRRTKWKRRWRPFPRVSACALPSSGRIVAPATPNALRTIRSFCRRKRRYRATDLLSRSLCGNRCDASHGVCVNGFTIQKRSATNRLNGREVKVDVSTMRQMPCSI